MWSTCHCTCGAMMEPGARGLWCACGAAVHPHRAQGTLSLHAMGASRCCSAAALRARQTELHLTAVLWLAWLLQCPAGPTHCTPRLRQRQQQRPVRRRTTQHPQGTSCRLTTRRRHQRASGAGKVRLATGSVGWRALVVGALRRHAPDAGVSRVALVLPWVRMDVQELVAMVQVLGGWVQGDHGLQKHPSSIHATLAPVRGVPWCWRHVPRAWGCEERRQHTVTAGAWKRRQRQRGGLGRTWAGLLWVRDGTSSCGRWERGIRLVWQGGCSCPLWRPAVHAKAIIVEN